MEEHVACDVIDLKFRRYKAVSGDRLAAPCGGLREGDRKAEDTHSSSS